MIENEKVEELMLELDDKLEKTISVLEGEYTAIRAGRANPHVLDRVEVEAYGGMSKLIELGNISALDARCLQIDRKSTRLNSSHPSRSRMPSSA